ERGEDRMEYRVVRPDGAVRWIEGRGVAFYDGAGRPERLVGVCADVTDDKRADARVTFLGEIARSITSSLDLDTVLRRVVEGAQALTGSDSAAIFLPDAESGAMASRHSLGPWWPGSEPLRFPPGRRLAEQTAVAIQNARLFGQQEAARAEAEAANRTKDEFLAMLGHELRNPLGAISSAAHVLSRTAGSNNASARASDVIGRQVQHLARIVDDLLDVSRVVAGKVVLRLQPVDLAEIARRVATLHGGPAGARHVISVHTTPTWVSADPTRLEQVLTNLLANSDRKS